LPLRHPITAHRDIGSLIRLVNGGPASLAVIVTATEEQSSVPAEAGEAS
jgi:hypothetical protein